MSGRELEVVIFSVDQQVYAVEIPRVQEFLWLPALASLEEQPAYILGSFELRGELVPVVDLNLRLGHPGQPLMPQQLIVVTRTPQGLIGLLADELLDSTRVTLLEGKASSVSGGPFRPLVNAQFKLGELYGTLLDPHELILGDRFPFEYLIERRDPLIGLSAADRDRLMQRQAEYREVEVDDSSQSGLDIAVVVISGEQFGIETKCIQEFAYLPAIFPLPGTPPFVVGNVNLRGEILTVFDISSLLSVDPVRIGDGSRLVIFSHDHQLLGIVVDELIDVAAVDPGSINEVPLAISEGRRALLKGECLYQQTSLVIVDIDKIFNTGQLLVDQE